MEQYDAVELVAALLNEMTKDDASSVPVKITPERPLPRRKSSNKKFYGSRNRNGKGSKRKGYYNDRKNGRDKKHDRSKRQETGKRNFTIRNKKD